MDIKKILYFSYFQNLNEYAINHYNNKLGSAFLSTHSDIPMSANLYFSKIVYS